MKLTTLVILVVLVVFTAFVHADDVSHRAAAEKLLKLSNVDKLIEPIFQQLKGMMGQQFAQTGVPQDRREILEKYSNKLFDLMSKEMSWDKVKDEYITMYVSTYTEKEMNEIIEFYKSQVGQRVIEKTPQTMQASFQISQKHVQRIMPQIQQISQEMAAELKQP